MNPLEDPYAPKAAPFAEERSLTSKNPVISFHGTFGVRSVVKGAAVDGPVALARACTRFGGSAVGSNKVAG
jgi:hypothetical protein